MKNLLLLITLVFSLPSIASTPLVSSEWLSDHLKDESLIMIDIRHKTHFDYVRIPASVHSDYSTWRQPHSKILKKMLPSKEALEKILSMAGIKNNSHIIIIGGGETASDLAAATRVYWTLDQIGHQQKSILKNGILGWATQRLPLTQNKPVAPPLSQYVIKAIKPQTTAKEVLRALDVSQIIDTRSVAEFKGLVASSDERKGTIKNSQSLPYDWFTKNQSSQFESISNIKNIASSINYDNNSNSIVYCHTGHRAALSWFVFHELLGNKNVALYDGSTRDWATQKNLPMTQEIHVE